MASNLIAPRYFNIYRAILSSIGFPGMFFASTMVMVSIALVMAVIVTNIYAKKDTPQRCPGWTVRLASRFYPAYYLPEGRDSAEPHYTDRHGRTFPLPAIIERRTVQPTSACLDASQLGVAEKGEADGGDCTGRQGCCSCLRRRSWSLKRGGSGSNGASRASRVTSRPPSSRVPMTLEAFDFRRSEAEWRMVAKFTDRVFFWLFFVMSLFVHANIFLRMIPATRHAVV